MRSEFIDLTSVCADILIEASYATSNNFTGQIVPGYKKKMAILPKAPALALSEVQTKALNLGFTLKVFDAYRPVKAVAFFQDWAKRPEDNLSIKKIFYPSYSRQELFDSGFIALRSSHSRGCAIDLTLADSKTLKELDMGSCFDYFDTLSYTDSTEINEDQRKNRQLLKDLMEGCGFKNYYQEWWHYSFRPEPFPGQYFDFDVE